MVRRRRADANGKVRSAAPCIPPSPRLCSSSARRYSSTLPSGVRRAAARTTARLGRQQARSVPPRPGCESGGPQWPRDRCRWRCGRSARPSRRDPWWVQPLVVFLGLSAFVVYSTWAAFQGKHYRFGPVSLAVLFAGDFRRLASTAGSGPSPAGGRHGCRSRRRC